MTLSVTDVKNAKFRGKPYKLTDTRGLHLLVSAAGGKSWRLKYRFAGKEKLITIGRYPEVGLVVARDLADDARKLLAGGKDPAVEARREKDRRIDAANATFSTIGDEWFEDQSPLWSRSNAARVRHRLVRDLYPAFGHVPIGNIDGQMVLRVLRKIEGRGSIETAKRVRAYVRAIFKRAKAERFVNESILLEIDEIRDALRPTPPGLKQPSLTTLPELLELQQYADRSTSGLIAKLGSRFIALTLVRVGVLRTAMWTEFTGINWADPEAPCDKPLWKIPAERMKLEVEDKLNPGFGHDVPLSLQAVRVLRVVRSLDSPSPYLFPHAKAWRDPMTDAALSTMYKRMGAGKFKGRMVPHGWRSSFSTIMNERAAELERDGDRMLIDMILSHVPKGVSASEWAYNRARYLRPRAGLLQAWADLISEGLAPPESLLPGSA